MTNQENDGDVSLWDIDLRCKACEWTGVSKNTEFTTRKNSKDILMVCPRCKTIDYFEVINEKE